MSFTLGRLFSCFYGISLHYILSFFLHFVLFEAFEMFVYILNGPSYHILAVCLHYSAVCLHYSAVCLHF